MILVNKEIIRRPVLIIFFSVHYYFQQRHFCNNTDDNWFLIIWVGKVLPENSDAAAYKKGINQMNQLSSLQEVVLHKCYSIFDNTGLNQQKIEQHYGPVSHPATPSTVTLILQFWSKYQHYSFKDGLIILRNEFNHFNYSLLMSIAACILFALFFQNNRHIELLFSQLM